MSAVHPMSSNDECNVINDDLFRVDNSTDCDSTDGPITDDDIPDGYITDFDVPDDDDTSFGIYDDAINYDPIQDHSTKLRYLLDWMARVTSGLLKTNVPMEHVPQLQKDILSVIMRGDCADIISLIPGYLILNHHPHLISIQLVNELNHDSLERMATTSMHIERVVAIEYSRSIHIFGFETWFFNR
ncbi:uncharacterized protein FPRO_14790 [Fusarium proliferatum ET1]|uniref:Uncharacterized protein n=1 Tax=Fusarium proliferatum (strain ET1) TaxID=1227346 RepID=A0A1L7WAW9_FUSPR|nr:uncharacterized protein FPRO_14790 [Fusarium proliferatum ET1]CZR49733.1 uncharacterized protein FPRO_14790 [Fusarium proliferatum ET1]